MVDLILRFLMRRKKHLWLTTLIVAGVFSSLLLLSLLFLGFFSGVRFSDERLGADAVIFPKEIPVEGSMVLLSGEPVNVYFDEKKTEDALKTIPGIERWTPQFFTQTLNADCCSVGGENRLVGIDWKSDFLVKPWLTTGKIENFKGNMAIFGGKVPFYEKEVQILGETFHIAGVLAPTGTGMDYTIFIPLEEAKRLAATSDTVVQYWEQDDPYKSLSAIFVKAEQGYNPDLLAYTLNRIPDVQIIQAGEVLGSTRESFAFIEKLLWLFLAVFLFLGLLGLVGRYTGYVLERKREFGLMMALGMTGRGLRGWLLKETLLSGLLGGLIGLLLSFAIYPFLLGWIDENPLQPFIPPSPMEWAILALLTYLVTQAILILAAFLPGRGISRLWAGRAMAEGELE